MIRFFIPQIKLEQPPLNELLSRLFNWPIWGLNTIHIGWCHPASNIFNVPADYTDQQLLKGVRFNLEAHTRSEDTQQLQFCDQKPKQWAYRGGWIWSDNKWGFNRCLKLNWALCVHFQTTAFPLSKTNTSSDGIKPFVTAKRENKVRHQGREERQLRLNQVEIEKRSLVGVCFSAVLLPARWEPQVNQRALSLRNTAWWATLLSVISAVNPLKAALPQCSE